MQLKLVLLGLSRLNFCKRYSGVNNLPIKVSLLMFLHISLTLMVLITSDVERRLTLLSYNVFQSNLIFPSYMYQYCDTRNFIFRLKTLIIKYEWLDFPPKNLATILKPSFMFSWSFLWSYSELASLSWLQARICEL